MSIVVPLSMTAMIGISGYFCKASENMIEAEQDIRNAYYELDWYKAPLVSRKLILMAMQEPEKIRFGRIFNSDYASMERFLLLIRRAYDFSLILLKLVKQ